MAIMRSHRSKQGFVYVISAPNGYVKIGSAGNPYERFSIVQCNSPLILTLAYVCECDNPVDVEVAAHEALADHRRHREWFEVPTDTAVDAVRAALQAAGAEPVTALHRSEKKVTNVGAPPLLRPLMNETVHRATI